MKCEYLIHRGTGELEIMEGEKDMAKKRELTVEEHLLQEIEKKEQELENLRKEIKDLEKYKAYEDAADEIKAMHTAFMNSGFSDDQAFALLNKLMDTMIPEIIKQTLFR